MFGSVRQGTSQVHTDYPMVDTGGFNSFLSLTGFSGTLASLCLSLRHFVNEFLLFSQGLARRFFNVMTCGSRFVHRLMNNSRKHHLSRPAGYVCFSGSGFGAVGGSGWVIAFWENLNLSPRDLDLRVSIALSA